MTGRAAGICNTNAPGGMGGRGRGRGAGRGARCGMGRGRQQGLTPQSTLTEIEKRLDALERK